MKISEKSIFSATGFLEMGRMSNVSWGCLFQCFTFSKVLYVAMKEQFYSYSSCQCIA
jgi:hypothetical protein